MARSNLGRDEIFLDTGIFIAWLVAQDRRHAATAELMETEPKHWCTSTLVVAEAYGWFLHRFDESRARVFRLALASMPNLRLLPADAAHHQAVGRKLDRLRGYKLTYVDASSLVFLAERKIKTVWGTDQDLAIEGAAVLPGPQ